MYHSDSCQVEMHNVTDPGHDKSYLIISFAVLLHSILSRACTSERGFLGSIECIPRNFSRVQVPHTRGFTQVLLPQWGMTLRHCAKFCAAFFAVYPSYPSPVFKDSFWTCMSCMCNGCIMDPRFCSPCPEENTLLPSSSNDHVQWKIGPKARRWHLLYQVRSCNFPLNQDLGIRSINY